MAGNYIKIKCPQCGAVLSVKPMAGLQTKNVTCPVCKYKGLFTTFKIHAPNQQESNDFSDSTQYAGGGGHGGFSDDTDLGHKFNQSPGQLRVLPTGQVFRLKEGRNVIGRQAAHSSANIQLPTGSGRRMSREHIVIDVQNINGKGMTAYISLFKKEVNKTLVNGNQLVYGDMIVLKDGNVVDLPDMQVRYEIPDEDKTEMK